MKQLDSAVASCVPETSAERGRSLARSTWVTLLAPVACTSRPSLSAATWDRSWSGGAVSVEVSGHRPPLQALLSPSALIPKSAVKKAPGCLVPETRQEFFTLTGGLPGTNSRFYRVKQVNP